MPEPTPLLLFNDESLMDTVREALLVLNADLRVRRANRSFFRTFNVAPKETEGRLVYELGNGQWDIPALRRLLEEILPQNTTFNDFEVVHDFPSIGHRVMLLNARRIYREGNDTELMLLAIEDITERRKLEAALAAQQESLRVTLQSIGDAVIATDTEGRITLLNPVAETVTGWTSPEASGLPLESVFQIVNESTRRKVENPVTKALREGNVVGLANHTLLIGKGGTERPIDDSAAPIRSADGDIIGVVLVFRDITERRKTERVVQAALEYAENIVETVRESMLVLDSDLRVKSANEAFYRTFRVSRAETVGRLVYDLGNRQWDIPALRQLLEHILPQQSAFNDFEVAPRFHGHWTKGHVAQRPPTPAGRCGHGLDSSRHRGHHRATAIGGRAARTGDTLHVAGEERSGPLDLHTRPARPDHKLEPGGRENSRLHRGRGARAALLAHL
jgi:PAS domain S-box-containing protein